jgi:hypothetical protein
MTTTAMFRKFRGYHHFIKKQQKHRDAFGVHPIRAVLVETTSEARARRLMELTHHPLVRGTDNRVGLFWFTISELFTDSSKSSAGVRGATTQRWLTKPGTVLGAIWALPDGTLHSLSDIENS